MPDRADPPRHLRQLQGSIDGVAAIRTAEFKGSPQMIVPVVALVGDSIVRPMGSSGPELVPSEELAFVPGGWNGRPVVPDHPRGGTTSANSPEILEAMAFGQLFNTRFEDGKLKTEAWIDVDTATRLGGAPLAVVERLRAGEAVEVSVGAFVGVERRPGSMDGQDYEVIWREIIPDHLALLPHGIEGACNIEMGCGAPRMNQQKKEGAKMPEEMTTEGEPSALSQVLSLLRELVLGSDQEEIMEKEEEATGAEDQPQGDAAQEEGADMSKCTVGRLIANEATPFTEDHRPTLEALGEETLAAMEETYAPAPEIEEEAEVEPVEEIAPEGKTEEQWMTEAPESLRSMVRKYQDEEKARRESLITSLAKATDAYSEEQLSTKDTADLQALTKALRLDEPRDYSGRGMPATEESITPPDAYAAGIEKLRATYGN